jgi:hypothetical protein
VQIDGLEVAPAVIFNVWMTLRGLMPRIHVEFPRVVPWVRYCFYCLLRIWVRSHFLETCDYLRMIRHYYIMNGIGDLLEEGGNADLTSLGSWLTRNRLRLHVLKSNYMIFGRLGLIHTLDIGPLFWWSGSVEIYSG